MQILDFNTLYVGHLKIGARDGKESDGAGFLLGGLCGGLSSRLLGAWGDNIPSICHTRSRRILLFCIPGPPRADNRVTRLCGHGLQPVHSCSLMRETSLISRVYLHTRSEKKLSALPELCHLICPDSSAGFSYRRARYEVKTSDFCI